tara:strand:- start:27 stop:257 length:231 start_codon:yes stop_codon:yes gene_type:complete
VASWAARALRLPRLPADTVVLRTRPDILWEARHRTYNKAGLSRSLRPDLWLSQALAAWQSQARAAPSLGHILGQPG